MKNSFNPVVSVTWLAADMKFVHNFSDQNLYGIKRKQKHKKQHQ